MVQLFFALLAGILTIAAPCILPVLPILLGSSIGQSSRSRPLFIVLGFVLAFSTFVLVISVLAQKLGFSTNTLRQIAIALLGVFGVFMLFPVWFERLTTSLTQAGARLSGNVARNSSQGNFGGFVLGATLGLVWTPCAGPVLGSILTLVLTQQDLALAGILLSAYALGAGLPMLLIAYGGQYVTTKVRFIAQYATVLQRVFGILIIALSIAMFYGYDTLLQAKLLEFYPGGQLQF